MTSPSFVLMNPGPVNVSDRVRQALSGPDLCHREPEFFDLQDRIRSGLTDLFGLDPAAYAAVLITGSGTAALEAAVSSAPSAGKGLVVINNGVYGARIAAMARSHSLPVKEVVSEWGSPPDLNAVEDAIRKFPEGEVVAVVHHETTTGLINPVDEVGALAQRHGRRLLVDTVSGLAGERYDFVKNRAALSISTANKCLQGLPGIAFVIATREELAREERNPERSYYLNLPRYFREQETRGTPFTPAVQVGYALDAAIRETAEETVAGRITRYQRASSFLRQGFERLGLECLLPEPLRSNTITTLALPRGRTYQEVHDTMREHGYVIYAGQGGLGKRYFRIANMGWINDDQLQGCLNSLADLLGKKP